MKSKLEYVSKLLALPKLCKPKQSSLQMQKSEETTSQLFKTHSNSAAILDLHEKAFNEMPLAVMRVITIPRIDSV